MYEILEPHPCEPNSWQLEEIKKVIKENELPDRAIVNRLVEYLWHVTDPEKPLIFCHVTDSERVAITSICHIFTVNYFPWRTIALPALLRVRFYRDLRYFQVEWEHSFAHREVGQYLNSSSGNMIPFGLLNVQECRNIHNLSRGGRPIMDGEGREGIQLDGSLSVINGSRSPQIICEVAVKETYASVVNKAIKWLTDFDSVNLVIIIVAKEQPVLILDKLTSEPDISGQVRLFETMMERMIYDHQMKHMADGEGEQDITVQTLMDQEPLSNLKYEDWLGEYWSEEHPCFIQFIRRPPKHRPGIDLDPEYVFRLPKLTVMPETARQRPDQQIYREDLFSEPGVAFEAQSSRGFALDLPQIGRNLTFGRERRAYLRFLIALKRDHENRKILGLDPWKFCWNNEDLFDTDLFAE